MKATAYLSIVFLFLGIGIVNAQSNNYNTYKEKKITLSLYGKHGSLLTANVFDNFNKFSFGNSDLTIVAGGGLDVSSYNSNAIYADRATDEMKASMPKRNKNAHWKKQINSASEDFMAFNKSLSKSGVSTNIVAWLKSESGTNTTTDGQDVTTWNNSVSNPVYNLQHIPFMRSDVDPFFDYIDVNSIPPSYESDPDNLLNFHPTILFEDTGNGIERLFVPNVDDATAALEAQPIRGSIVYIIGRPKGVKNQFWTGFELRINPGTSNDAPFFISHNQILFIEQNRDANGRRYSRSISTDLTWSNDEIAFIKMTVPDVATANITYNKNGGADDVITGINVSDGYYHAIGNWGGNNKNNEPFGNIAETIIYNSASISEAENSRIQSYLALKYGITLDQTTAQSYVNSSGEEIYDADGVFDEFDQDIIGIGRDKGSSLDQRISKSVNAGAALILSNDADFTSTNVDQGRTSLDNGNFLVVGNNGGSVAFYEDFLGRFNVQRVSGVWAFDKTGDVEDVHIAIAVDDITVSRNNLYAIISSDQVFDDTDAITRMFSDGTYWSAEIKPGDGNFMTFVSTDINLQADLYIKDFSNDVGVEPNPIAREISMSPDIWVRNTLDGGDEHQNPKYYYDQTPNYVYIKIRNRGHSTSSGDDQLHLYWSKKIVGELKWPESWDGTLTDDGILMGGVIGTINIPVLEPSEETTLALPWNVPYPGDYNDMASVSIRSFSLLARIESQDDPITIKETRFVRPNVRNNNNIAMKDVRVRKDLDDLNVDLYIKDFYNDVGLEPNPISGEISNSPDIWIRHNPDGINQDQNPLYQHSDQFHPETKKLNYVYFKVKNRGSASSWGDEILTLNWSKTSSGLSWPEDWDGTSVYENNHVKGDPIGIITIPVLEPGEETTLFLPWQVPYLGFYEDVDPSPSKFSLLARIIMESHGSLMVLDETSDVRLNARNSNDIALKSVIAKPRIDLYIKDFSDDRAIEPNQIEGKPWRSPDIWVRNNDDGEESHQNPVYSPDAPNYVYVRVTNRSSLTSLGNDGVKLYWRKAGTVSRWPSSWDGTNTEDGILMSGLIGTIDIPELEPGKEAVLSIPWQTPNPSDYIGINPNPWHFCFLARIISESDPMTDEQETYTSTNTRRNNNIAWKNVTIVKTSSGAERKAKKAGRQFGDINFGGVISVGNPFNDARTFSLELVREDSEGGKAIFKKAEVAITMDQRFYDVWKSGGKQSRLIKSTNDQKIKLIKGNHARLDGLTFKPNQRGTLNLTFNFLSRELTDKSRFVYHVVQKDAETGEVVGGETYIINKNSRPLFERSFKEYGIVKTKKGINPTSKASLDKIIPNPVSNKVRITYNLDGAKSAHLMVVGFYQLSTKTTNNYDLDTNSEETTFDLKHYSNGYYQIALICDEKIVDVKTLIKE